MRTDALAHSAGWILVFKINTHHSVVTSLSLSVHELHQAALAELVGRLGLRWELRPLVSMQLPLFFGASTNAQVGSPNCLACLGMAMSSSPWRGIALPQVHHIQQGIQRSRQRSVCFAQDGDTTHGRMAVWGCIAACSPEMHRNACVAHFEETGTSRRSFFM